MLAFFIKLSAFLLSRFLNITFRFWNSSLLYARTVAEERSLLDAACHQAGVRVTGCEDRGLFLRTKRW
jgi:hypothetical protein